MRGRTNITQRALPYVNGDVITAEVETGNTIGVGDFVEYKTSSVISEAGFDADIIDNYIEQILLEKNNHKYMVALKKNVSYELQLELWDNDTSSKIYTLLLDSSSDLRPVGGFDILPNGDIIAFSILTARYYSATGIYYDQGVPSAKFYYIKLENNVLVIKNQKEFNFANELWQRYSETFDITTIRKGISSIGIIDNSHFIIISHGWNTTNPNYFYHSYATIISFSNETIGSVVKSIELAFESSYLTYSYFDAKSYTSSGIYKNGLYSSSVRLKNGSSSSSTEILFILKLNIDSSYNITFDYEIIYSQGGSTSIIVYGRKIGNGCVALCYKLGTSSPYLIISYIKQIEGVYILQKITKYIQSLLNLGAVSTGCENNVLFVSGSVGSKWYLRRIEFIESENTIKESNNFELSTVRLFTYKNISNPIGYYMSGNEINNKKVNLLYSVGDNELDAGVYTNYVKQYNNGKAIGFAKTAGVAGENIRIYVPHNS